MFVTKPYDCHNVDCGAYCVHVNTLIVIHLFLNQSEPGKKNMHFNQLHTADDRLWMRAVYL